MRIFPIEALKAVRAVLSGQPGNACLEIDLEPFELDGDIIDTSIRLDPINLPTIDVAELSGQAFDFPVNPEDGYIDGSVYIDSAHHPVDVTHLRFTEAEGGQYVIELNLCFILEFEGLRDFANTGCLLTAPLLTTA